MQDGQHSRGCPSSWGGSAQTHRRWEREDKLLPLTRTAGGHRRYVLARLRTELFRAEVSRRTIAYPHVSSYDLKDELEGQEQMLGCSVPARASRLRSLRM
ncbi:hypothetical protein MFUM_970032 [Methylacidiphilum fumariolicum SolV]|uniref:Uncharacterized protein n=2 Tax=Candidatus Methylacidiphilum fumarolicum TaxID=591154 RepID=I0K193_METFB|nr:conserved protein of unknown function [Candidatus Methylacidiphilum fumarolicum]CCG93262.1 hypothetical protein MFUM_970032 [Methylacidiphilum fumariolicum SolV]